MRYTVNVYNTPESGDNLIIDADSEAQALTLARQQLPGMKYYAIVSVE